MNIIDLDRRASVRLSTLIDATSIDQFDAPTPCPAWSVRDLLAHLIAGNVKYTHIAHGSDWGRGVPDVELGDDPAGEYRETIEAMLHAWGQPGVLERETPLPVGQGTVEAAFYLHLGETLVHGWDLAIATKQQPAFDVEVVEASLVHFMSWLPAQRPPGTPFSDARLLGDEAPPIDRLASFLGRDVEAWRV